jgi:hypothetical protein
MDVSHHKTVDEDDEASGVNVWRLQGEKFTSEDGYLPNVVHHVSRSQLELQAQRIYEPFCDVMARDTGDVLGLISNMNEVFGCANGTLGVTGQSGARHKGSGEWHQNFKDPPTAL